MSAQDVAILWVSEIVGLANLSLSLSLERKRDKTSLERQNPRAIGRAAIVLAVLRGRLDDPRGGVPAANMSSYTSRLRACTV